MDPPATVLVRDRISPAELARLVHLHFGDMVKFVVDLERRILAIGGELHADAEQVLLEDGSRQFDLWGANYFPGRGEVECIEYTSLINIRPARGNRGMVVEELSTQEAIREIVFERVGRGEPLT